MAMADVRQQALDLFTRGTTQPGGAREALASGETKPPRPLRGLSRRSSASTCSGPWTFTDRFMANR